MPTRRADRQRWQYEQREPYPADWERIADEVKTAADWRCLACCAPHGYPPHILTVDHLDDDPSNNGVPGARPNLIALCQRCHLRKKAMVPWPQTREECLRRLRARAALDRSQLALIPTEGL